MKEGIYTGKVKINECNNYKGITALRMLSRLHERIIKGSLRRSL